MGAWARGCDRAPLEWVRPNEGRRVALTSSSCSSSSSATVASSVCAAGWERPSRPTIGRSESWLRISSNCEHKCPRGWAITRRGSMGLWLPHLLLVGHLAGDKLRIFVVQMQLRSTEPKSAEPNRVRGARKRRRRQHHAGRKCHRPRLLSQIKTSQVKLTSFPDVGKT